MRPSRWPRPRPAAPLSAIAPAGCATSCAFKRSAGSATTIDNIVKWRGLTLQIPPSPLRSRFVRATVRVHKYPDGRLASSTDRTCWPITTRRATCAMTSNWLRKPLRQPARGLKGPVLPNLPAGRYPPAPAGDRRDVPARQLTAKAPRERAASLYLVIGHWAQVSCSTTRQLNAPSTKGWRRLPSRVRPMNAAR